MSKKDEEEKNGEKHEMNETQKSIRFVNNSVFRRHQVRNQEEYTPSNCWNFYNCPLRIDVFERPRRNQPMLPPLFGGPPLVVGNPENTEPKKKKKKRKKRKRKKKHVKMKDEDEEEEEEEEEKEKEGKSDEKEKMEDEKEEEKYLHSRKPVVHQQWQYINKSIWENWNKQLTQTPQTLPLINRFEEMFCPTMFLYLLDDEMKALLPTLFNLCHLSREELKDKLDGAERIFKELKNQVTKGLSEIEENLKKQTELFKEHVVDKIKQELIFSQRVQPNLSSKLSQFRVKFRNERRAFGRILTECSDVLELIFQYLTTKQLLVSCLPVCSFFSSYIRTRIPLNVVIPSAVVLLNFPLDVILSSYRVQSVVFESEYEFIDHKAFEKLLGIIENNVNNLKHVDLANLNRLKDETTQKRKSFLNPFMGSHHSRKEYKDLISKFLLKSKTCFETLRETLKKCFRLRSISMDQLPLPLSKFENLECINFSFQKAVMKHGASLGGFGLGSVSGREECKRRMDYATLEMNSVYDFIHYQNYGRRITKINFTSKQYGKWWRDASRNYFGGGPNGMMMKDQFKFDERREIFSKLYDCVLNCPNLRDFRAYILDGFECVSGEVARRLPFIKFVKLQKLSYPPPPPTPIMNHHPLMGAPLATGTTTAAVPNGNANANNNTEEVEEGEERILQSLSFKKKNSVMNTHFEVICQEISEAMNTRSKEYPSNKDRYMKFIIEYARLFPREKTEITAVMQIPNISVILPISFERGGMGFFGNMNQTSLVFENLVIKKDLRHIRDITLKLTGRVDLGGRPEFENFFEEFRIKRLRFEENEIFGVRHGENVEMIIRNCKEKDMKDLEELSMKSFVTSLKTPLLKELGELIGKNKPNLKKIILTSPLRRLVRRGWPGIPMGFRGGIGGVKDLGRKVLMDVEDDDLEKLLFDKIKKNDFLKVLKIYGIKKIQDRVDILLNKNSLNE